jgi:hypothetical protein
VYCVGVGGFAGKLGMMVQNCCTYPPREEIFSASLLFFSSFLGLRVFSSGKRGNKERDLFFANLAFYNNSKGDSNYCHELPIWF